MNLTTHSTFNWFSRIRIRSGLVFMLIMVVALIAFEMFNYSTTDFALNDLLGNLKFAGIGWSTILSIAFCGIDFAGIAQLFTPEQGRDEPKEVWYLFGAWMLAATMNAILTWWGVSMAIANHTVRSTSVLDANTLLKVVPIFVAVMVWVIRVLIIGTLSVAGDRFLNGEKRPYAASRGRSPSAGMPAPAPSFSNAANMSSRPSYSASARPSYPARPSDNRPAAVNDAGPAHPEPTYQSLNAAALKARPAVRPAVSLGDPSTSSERHL